MPEQRKKTLLDRFSDHVTNHETLSGSLFAKIHKFDKEFRLSETITVRPIAKFPSPPLYEPGSRGRGRQW